MQISQRPSPNFDSRNGTAVDILLLHYTGMTSAAAALARLADPAARVSAHYVVDEDGSVVQMVDEAARAWHAGVASWAGATDINARSVGIEIVNPGHEFGYRPFPPAQIASVIAVSKAIVQRHGIVPQRVLAHSDVAPDRKTDPGELFPWAELARAGIGLWDPDTCGAPPSGAAAREDGETVRAVQSALARFGYGLAVSGKWDAASRTVFTAFQRHFHPAAIGTGAEGMPDAASRARQTRSSL